MQCLIWPWLVGGKEREGRLASGGDEIKRRQFDLEGDDDEIERR